MIVTPTNRAARHPGAHQSSGAGRPIRHLPIWRDVPIYEESQGALVKLAAALLALGLLIAVTATLSFVAIGLLPLVGAGYLLLGLGRRGARFVGRAVTSTRSWVPVPSAATATVRPDVQPPADAHHATAGPGAAR